MRTSITRRILSVVLLASMLVSMLGSSFAFAAEIPADEPEAEAEEFASEDAPAEEVSEETEISEAAETTEEVEPVSEETETPSDEGPASEETEDAAQTPVEEPVSYTYDGYKAPNLFADEVPDYFLDQSNWNVLDNSEPVLPISDLSEEEQMAEANQELISSSVMATSDGYDYEEELSKFPRSYQPYLEALHELHPDWVFVAVNTGLTWEEVIDGELGAASTIDYDLNNTTHHLLLNNHDGYYSTSSYSSTNGYKPIDGHHVSCSRAAIAYYMDPRNFLIEKYIFQFEDQSYSSVQQLEGVEKILKSADSTAQGLYHMKNYVTTSGTTATLASLGSDYGSDYSTIIYRSGMASSVSPYFLASKIVQETGATTTNASISGTYSGYTGIYNFYNIGAYASTTGEAVANGLKYAKEHGWTNPILAVKGGADFLASSYIAKGQNTGYYMRFNVSPDAYYSTYSHQYMSATYAVAAEATSTLSGYKDADAVDSAFLFYIPVYDNMPDQDSTVSLTAATKGTTNASAKLYDVPSTHSSTLLTTIPSGSTVTVLGGSVTSDDTYISRLYYPYWYKVTVTVSGTSYTGYVREELVNLNANYTLKAGTQQTLANILSAEGNVGTIYYETSNPNVATVSDSGIITTKANGTCKIYAISTGGSFDAIGVTVSSSGSSGSTVTSLDTPTLKDAASTTSGIKVTWNKVSNAAGYALYRKISSTSWSRIATISSGSTVSYTDTDVTSGETYTYTVRATNGSVNSGYDNTGISCLYLSTPALSSISNSTNNGITVNWEKVPGATGYTFWRKTSSTSWTKIATISSGSTVSYTDTSDLASGTTYIYTVRAFTSGALSAYDTSGLSRMYLSNPKLASTAINNGSISVNWNSVTGATGYTVWRKTASSGWTKLTTLSSGSATTYKDTAVSSGTTYIYTVRAFSGNGQSNYDTTGIQKMYLATPALNSAASTSSSVTVKWDAVTGATGYTVWRKVSGASWSKIATLSSDSTTSYTDSSSLTAGTTYIYTVRAFADGALSAYDTTGISVVFKSSGSSNNSSPSEKLVNYVVRQEIYYRTGPSKAAVAAGTLKAGAVVQIISGWSTTADELTWYKMKLDGTIYYVAGNYLLATPTLKSTSNVDGGVQVSWEEVSTGTGYTLWRKTSPSSGWSKIATLSSSGITSYKDTNVSSGTTYYYTVRATYGSAASRYSTTGISQLYLSTPTLKSATASSSSVKVTWGSVSGAGGYTVWRKTANSSSWSKIATVSSGSTTSYTDSSSLTSGTTYYYTVRATGSGTLSYYNKTGISVTFGSSSSVTLVNYVTTGNVNYRTGPGTNYSLAGTLASGTTVKVVAGESYDVDGTPWYRVYINGNYYYMSSKYLKKA